MSEHLEALHDVVQKQAGVQRLALCIFFFSSHQFLEPEIKNKKSSSFLSHTRLFITLRAVFRGNPKSEYCELFQKENTALVFIGVTAPGAGVSKASKTCMLFILEGWCEPPELLLFKKLFSLPVVSLSLSLLQTCRSVTFSF